MTLRLFAALALPDTVEERLIALQRGVPGAAWRPRENLHLTLRFFGEMDEAVADDLDGELAALRHTPFDLQLKGAGSFGGADPHALWIGVAPCPSLMALAERCERAARRAGLAPDKRKFTPHVTLAYLRGADLARVQAFQRRLALFESESFRVDRFGLYSSWPRRGEANIYQIERDYPFG